MRRPSSFPCDSALAVLNRVCDAGQALLESWKCRLASGDSFSPHGQKAASDFDGGECMTCSNAVWLVQQPQRVPLPNDPIFSDQARQRADGVRPCCRARPGRASAPYCGGIRPRRRTPDKRMSNLRPSRQSSACIRLVRRPGDELAGKSRRPNGPNRSSRFAAANL